jgi:hypothetical protein
MDEPTPFPIGNIPQPKTSALAIWSLVLGVLSLVCFSIIAAIPGVICGHKALSRIKYSGGRISGQGLAIAGLVTGYIGIAWAIFFIPMMMAIVAPHFATSRTVSHRPSVQNLCIINLLNISTAKNQWALEKKKTDGDIPTIADLTPYFKDGKFPICPGGGIYTIGAVSNAPTCSIPGHEMPVY